MCITTSRAVSACVACLVAMWASFGFEDGWRVIWRPGARRRPSRPGRAARGPARGRQGRAGASCRLSRLEDGPDRRGRVPGRRQRPAPGVRIGRIALVEDDEPILSRTRRQAVDFGKDEELPAGSRERDCVVETVDCEFVGVHLLEAPWGVRARSRKEAGPREGRTQRWSRPWGRRKLVVT